MNYEELSDFDIGVKVCKLRYPDATHIGENTQGYPPSIIKGGGKAKEFYKKLHPEKFDKNIVLVLHGDLGLTFNINNPSDAWPIIQEAWGELNNACKYDFGLGLGESDSSVWDARMHMYGDNALKAAMIVYLMMNEKEK